MQKMYRERTGFVPAIQSDEARRGRVDVAEAIIYMAAASAKLVTGEVLTVDGGQRRWVRSGPWVDHPISRWLRDDEVCTEERPRRRGGS